MYSGLLKERGIRNNTAKIKYSRKYLDLVALNFCPGSRDSAEGCHARSITFLGLLLKLNTKHPVSYERKLAVQYKNVVLYR